MTDPAFLPAKRQAAMIRRGEIGCLELLDHHIARIERLDPKINAVVVRDFDRARKRARALDRKRGSSGRLHGVPMTVKESFDIAGLPTTWGVVEKRNDIAEKNAVAVDRLQAEGAVIFGKTNVPLMLGDWQSFNEIYGVTNNPWNPDRSSGGSSGGSAAAIAAGLGALEVGSDIGGSIRQPAHACGVFGHKPTWGLLPPTGQAPMAGVVAMTDISVIGPLARSAGDLQLAFEILAGPEQAETAMHYNLPRPRLPGLAGLRIAVWAEDPVTATDAEITAMLHDLARHLRREGAKVSLTARPAFDPMFAFEIYMKLLIGALSRRFTQAEIDDAIARRAKLSPDDRSADAIAVRSLPMSHPEWLNANEQRMRLRRAWGAFFQDWDVLLCPVHGAPALPHRHDAPTRELRIEINGTEIPWNNLLFWPGITCGFHLPASATPLGMTKSGLPVGVQIAGPLYGDRSTLALAAMLEKSWRGYISPPGCE